jgi:hypothetical protein
MDRRRSWLRTGHSRPRPGVFDKRGNERRRFALPSEANRESCTGDHGAGSARPSTDEINPQTGPVSVLEAIYQVVGHFQQHTGQIIFATKMLAGEDLGIYRKRLLGPHNGDYQMLTDGAL